MKIGNKIIVIIITLGFCVLCVSSSLMCGSVENSNKNLPIYNHIHIRLYEHRKTSPTGTDRHSF
jgi:hypothetical protein